MKTLQDYCNEFKKYEDALNTHHELFPDQEFDLDTTRYRWILSEWERDNNITSENILEAVKDLEKKDKELMEAIIKAVEIELYILKYRKNKTSKENS